MDRVRYIVIGAGAIGGVVGGALAEAGQDVVLVARGAHGAAIRSRGLLLRYPDRDALLSIASVESIADVDLRAGDVVFLAVKSQQTAAALDELLSQSVEGVLAGEALPLFCLQNGIANEDAALREVRSVHGVCVNLAASFLQPGVVDAPGFPLPGILELGLATGGSDDVDRAVAADLTASGFTAHVRENVMAWKAAKLLRNLGNASQALFGSPDEPAERDALARIRSAVQTEGRAVLAAAGREVVDDDSWDAALSGLGTAPIHGRERSGGSTWQSLERGTGEVETGYLNGEIVRVGRWLGIPTPANEALVASMRRLLRVGGAPGTVPPSVVAAEFGI